jgi:hypothetical protein
MTQLFGHRAAPDSSFYHNNGDCPIGRSVRAIFHLRGARARADRHICSESERLNGPPDPLPVTFGPTNR